MILYDFAFYKANNKLLKNHRINYRHVVEVFCLLAPVVACGKFLLSIIFCMYLSGKNWASVFIFMKKSPRYFSLQFSWNRSTQYTYSDILIKFLIKFPII